MHAGSAVLHDVHSFATPVLNSPLVDQKGFQGSVVPPVQRFGLLAAVLPVSNQGGLGIIPMACVLGLFVLTVLLHHEAQGLGTCPPSPLNRLCMQFQTRRAMVWCLHLIQKKHLVVACHISASAMRQQALPYMCICFLLDDNHNPSCVLPARAA
jgi:hypothetical protein